MSRFTVALIFVLCIDLFLFFGQAAMTDINPNGTQFYTGQGHILSAAAANNSTYVIAGVEGALPSGDGAVTSDTGNIFTDTYGVISGWFYQAKNGVTWLLNIVNAVPNFLKALALPEAFVYGVGALWHLLTLFLIVAFWTGRND